ncbi:MAG: sialate O-acetylesterase [Planctomycetaceae bacterium]
MPPSFPVAPRPLRACGLLVAALLAAAPLAALPARAAVTLAPFFGDHAVLQRDRPLPVWGRARPGERVAVRFGGAAAGTVAGPCGAWSVELPALPASSEPRDLVVAGEDTVVARDVVVGDVWLASGQSNMDWSLGGCDAPEEIAAAEHPGIRHFRVPMHFAATPQRECGGAWRRCTPEHAPGFSAVGYAFARRVHRDTGVPLGILLSSVGGTNIECWMRQETLLGTPELEPFAALMRASLETHDRELRAALPAMEAWTRAAREAEAKGRPVPLPPAIPPFPFGEQGHRPRCVTLHNGMIEPLLPLAIRGAIWYQGESNAGGPVECAQYVAKKRALVADWRRFFRDPGLPFHFVQLAAWLAPTDDPAGGDGWAAFRDAQRLCLAIPGTGMASAIDVGDAGDIHPRNKFDVGERLALSALAGTYGRDVEPSGPLFRRLVVEGNVARVEFDHLGGGLMVGKKEGRAPAVEDPGASLARFAIAGEDRVWHWAEARIEGDTVACTSPRVPRPVAVRYAHSMNPTGANLYNRAGLPASPFRSDDW